MEKGVKDCILELNGGLSSRLEPGRWGVAKISITNNEVPNRSLSPTVSIVTPSFNQMQFLEQTIRSVLNQSYDNIEYVVIDGGSTDGSVDVLGRYSHKLTYWVSEPDQGPADACNKGFQHTNGEILGYLNSDDVLLPHAVETVVRVFMAKPSVDVVYGDVYIIDENNRVLQKMFSASFFNPYLYVLGGFDIAQQATFWHRSLFESVGEFNPRNKTCWDAELWVDMALQGAKFRHVNQFLAGFRHHPASISMSGRLASEYWKDRERLFQKVFGRSPTAWDRYVLSPISRALGKLVLPQKLFPRLGIGRREIEVD